jgi:hypothetical protein
LNYIFNLSKSQEETTVGLTPETPFLPMPEGRGFSESFGEGGFRKVGDLMLEQMELFPLSPAEVAQRSKELAALCRAQRLTKAAAKALAKDYKERLAQIDADIARVSDSVTHEAEYRDPYGRALREFGGQDDDGEG